MDNLKIYYKLIRRAEERNTPNSYVEKHHVLPVSIFGENDFIVNLTYREHFIAHLLLAKIFEEYYGLDHEYTRKMNMAIHRMVYTSHSTIKTSRMYEIARMSVIKSKRGSPRPDMKGKRYFGASEETIRKGIEKMRQKRIGMKINYPKTRKPLSGRTEEVFKKISLARQNTKKKYIEMTDEEFNSWVKSQKKFSDFPNGKRANSNIIVAFKARKVPLNTFYSESDFSETWLKHNKLYFYGI